MTRKLTCQHCGAVFQAKRPHARFCSASCRAAHWAERRENSRQTAGERVVEASRRPSREGRGAKVYLTFAELVHLEQARARLQLPPTPAGQRLDQKFAAAHERIQRKESR